MINKEKTITISLDEYNRLLESQKQVDALKLDLENWKMAAYGYKHGEEQAVKDTAKEIYRELIEMEENPCNSREEIYQAVFGKRGVEVE